MTDLAVASPKRSAPKPALPVDVAAPERPPYLMAAFVALGTLLLYVATLAPTTQFWDTSEYIAAAKVLGIPHPPGNPLFTLLAHTFGMIPWSASYAVRINLFAAVTSAVAAGCWFLIGERFLRDIVPATWPRRLAALAGAVCAATAFTVWNQSVVNEKVYTLSLLSIALILWFILRWDDQHPGTAHDHYLLLILYLLALTSTNHMMGVLVGPVVAVLLFPPLKDGSTTSGEERRVEWTQWWVFCAVYAMIVASGLESWKPLAAASLFYVSALLFAWWHANNWRFALLALAVVVLGVSVYVFLPIRAAHYPAINEGEPTNWRALYDVLTRAQYGKPPVTQRQASFFAQLLMWGQYFSWQWGHDLAERWQALLGVLFGFLGLLGAWRHWLADRRRALAMTVMMVTFTLLLIFYLNFKYGYSQSLANTDWYVRQMQRRPIVTYDSAAGPAIYRGHVWPKPTGPLLNFTAQQVDSLPQYYPLNQRQGLNLAGVNVTLDPQMLGREWIERADIVVLEAIKDNLAKRPIYFSRTVGLYADQFSLTGYLEGQGFARRLHGQPITPSDSIQPVGQLGYVNIPRSTTLLFDVYHISGAARPRPRGWVDRPSEGILQTYGLMYTALSEAVRRTNPTIASRALVIADSIFKNTTLSSQPPGEVRRPPSSQP